MREDRKRNEEKEKELRKAARLQTAAQCQLDGDRESVAQKERDVQAWHDKVCEDARHESIGQQKAIAGRMVAIAKDMNCSLRAVSEGSQFDKRMTQAQINRMLQLSTGMVAQANNMRYNRHDGGWQPSETDGLTGRVEYSHPVPRGQGARTYVHQSAPSRPTYSRVAEQRVAYDATEYDPTARVCGRHAICRCGAGSNATRRGGQRGAYLKGLQAAIRNIICVQVLQVTPGDSKKIYCLCIQFDVLRYRAIEYRIVEHRLRKERIRRV